MIVEGNPAEVRAVNSIAMIRRGYAPEAIEALKDAFRRLFRDNDTVMHDKLVDLKASTGAPWNCDAATTSGRR
jgi:acyl-[acyl carrier protein]--UDP-N-acetylglucosamine O-acyltransferase